MSGSPFLVRDAAPGDTAAIAGFNARLAAETEEKALDPETLAAGVAAVLADPAKGRYFVAELAVLAETADAAGDGGPIGCLMITWEWSDWRNGAFWWIQSVYVRPENRGRGAFRALLDRAAAEATAAGAVGLRLYAERENRGALATYARCGFSEPGYLVLERVPV